MWCLADGGSAAGPRWERRPRGHRYGESCVDGNCRCDTVFDGRSGSVEGLIDLPSVEVELQLRINGQPVPVLPESQRANVSIRHEGSTQWRPAGILGSTDGYLTTLIPGRYRVLYEPGLQHAWSPGILTPENEETDFAELIVPAAGGTVIIDVPATDVTFRARINGVAVPSTLPATELARLSIRHRGATEWTYLGLIGGELAGIAWRLIPGTYEVLYQKGSQHTWREGILTPENEPTVFGTVVIPPAGGLVTIDVPAATVTFEGLINGVVVPTNLAETELGDLRIRHVGATDWIFIGTLGRGMLGPDWRLLAGTYEVAYEPRSNHTWREGILTPENEETVFTTFTSEEDGPIAIDLPATDVTFTAWLDGAPAPTNLPSSQQGMLSIRREGATGWTVVGRLGGQMIGPSWRLITGTYQIRYTTAAGFVWADGILTPENKETITGTFEVPRQGGPLVLPIRASSVTVSVHVNGAPAPTDIEPNGQGIIRFRHVGATEWLRLSDVGGPVASEPWRLLEGEYEYQYTRATNIEVPNRFMPENGSTWVGRFTVPAADGPIVLPLGVTEVRFRGRVNGQPWPTLPTSEHGSLGFLGRGETDGANDVLVIGLAEDQDTWRLLGGTYRVFYETGSGYRWRPGILAPANPETDIGCFELLTPGR
ncbi:MAG TPA: hypothetical protein PK095_22465 [Myxococcota bacterium]|nr:hypothetical protein [Myxococcota bacterium]